jgi:hypothetical protein
MPLGCEISIPAPVWLFSDTVASLFFAFTDF